MKNKRQHSVYERLRSWYNIWVGPMIMSSLSTESTLKWRLVRVNKMATLPQHWWIGFSVMSYLILYKWQNVIFVYLLHALVPVTFIHMLLENIQE